MSFEQSDAAERYAAALARIDAIREEDIEGLSEAELEEFYREAKPFVATPPAEVCLLREGPPRE